MKTSEAAILFLLKNPKEKASINMLAKKIQRAPSGVFRALKKLEKESILRKETVGNSSIYGLNLGNIEAARRSELALMAEKKEIIGKSPHLSLLSKDLTAFEKYADLVVLFGSAVQKKEYRDIDVLLIAKQKHIKGIESAARKLSALYGKNITPLILTHSDLAGNIKKQDRVILEIVRTGAVLSGYGTFVEAIKHAKI